MVGEFLDRAVDKLGNIAGLDARYYLGQSFYLAMAQAVGIGCAFLGSVAFTRLVSKDAYGAYSFVLAIVGVMTLFSLPGIATAVGRAAARNQDRTFVEGTRVRLRWSLLGSAILVGVGVYYYLVGSMALGKSFLVVSLFFPLFSSSDTFRAFLHGKMLFRRSSVYATIINVGGLAVTVTAIYLSRDLFWMVVSYVAFMAAVRSSFLIATLRMARGNLRMDMGAIGYGKHLSLLSVVSTVASYYDSILIGAYLGFQDLAIYNIARVGEYAAIPLSLLLIPAFPQMVRAEKAWLMAVTKRKLPRLMLGYGVFCAAWAAALLYLIPAFYTTAYSPAIPYAQLIVVSVLLGVPGEIIMQTFKAQGLVRRMYVFGLVRVIFSVVLPTVLVTQFGLLGVVLAKVFQSAAASIVASLSANMR